MKDPYKILNIRKDAEQEVIAAAYKALARKYHPDVSELDAEKMKEINWAYDLLRDAKRRLKWDSQQTDGPKKQGEKSRPKPTPQSKSKTDGDPKDQTSEKAFRPSAGRWLVGGVWIALFLWIASLMGDKQTFNSQSLTTKNPLGSATTIRSTLTVADTGVGAALSTAIEKRMTLVAASPEEQFILNNNCIIYSEVNSSNLGETICVFGTVNRDWCSGAYEIVAFTNNYSNYDSTDFRLVAPGGVPDSLCSALSWHYLTVYEDAFEEVASQVTWFDGLSQPGNCIAAIGEITRFEDFSYVAIDIGRPETYLIWLLPFPCEN